MRIISFIVIIVLSGGLIDAYGQEKQIVGLVEKVKICPENLTMYAKLDTGAEHSSLSATNIQEFYREGKQWIRFDVHTLKGLWGTREKRLIRIAKIKRHRGETHERPVIKLLVCLGNQQQEVEFNLTDRRKFEYQMLIGRSLLNGRFIVDPSIKLTTQPSCRETCGK